MSILVGEAFEDFGNAPEAAIDSIPAYEILGDGMIRIFVCKTVRTRRVLDHSDLMTRGKLYAIGRRLIEIADEVGRAPEVVFQGEDRKFH